MENESVLRVKRLSGDATLPSRGTPDAAGLDLCASEERLLKAGAVETVPTAISIEIPAGCVGLVWPRSGLSMRHGIGTLAGVIDADYRGEIRVVLVNHGSTEYAIQKGDRIAQLLIQKIERLDPVESEDLAETTRGARGFGSSGR
ncbi:MAG: hypothetical protein A3G34_17525 [Candidatus Lindowbacteria bacterium RIFCSPLOWO2_12_FULL_62_27]|nr:MAG: hypothetical protein A3G34_17525 [Candidatus Lindowbacteria bacterium RIFCSPLOWO2_12_FULL_62_27]